VQMISVPDSRIQLSKDFIFSILRPFSHFLPPPPPPYLWLKIVGGRRGGAKGEVLGGSIGCMGRRARPPCLHAGSICLLIYKINVKMEE